MAGIVDAHAQDVDGAHGSLLLPRRLFRISVSTAQRRQEAPRLLSPAPPARCAGACPPAGAASPAPGLHVVGPPERVAGHLGQRRRVGADHGRATAMASRTAGQSPRRGGKTKARAPLRALEIILGHVVGRSTGPPGPVPAPGLRSRRAASPSCRRGSAGAGWGPSWPARVSESGEGLNQPHQVLARLQRARTAGRGAPGHSGAHGQQRRVRHGPACPADIRQRSWLEGCDSSAPGRGAWPPSRPDPGGARALWRVDQRR